MRVANVTRHDLETAVKTRIQRLPMRSARIQARSVRTPRTGPDRCHFPGVSPSFSGPEPARRRRGDDPHRESPAIAEGPRCPGTGRAGSRAARYRDCAWQKLIPDTPAPRSGCQGTQQVNHRSASGQPGASADQPTARNPSRSAAAGRGAHTGRRTPEAVHNPGRPPDT